MGALTIPSQQQSPILSMIRQEFPEYHPLLAIARLAHTVDDDKLAFECHKTIAKYVAPELKSIEVKAPPDEHRRVRVSMFETVDVEYTMVGVSK